MMNVDGQREAVGIGDDVPQFYAARPFGMHRRSTLATDDGRRRRRTAAELSPRLPNNSREDPCHLPCRARSKNCRLM